MKNPIKKSAPPAKKLPFGRSADSSKKSAPAKAKSSKKPLPTYKAPADFKPHFLLVQVTTEKDGLIGGNVKATRYQGRFDREAPEKKKVDLSTYDPATLLGITARLSAVTFKANAEKKFSEDPKARMTTKGSMRLPASTTFQILIRVGKKSADNTLTAGVKGIWQGVVNKKGQKKLAELDKKDPAYRAFRKSSRILPAAFKAVQIPPKRQRGSAVEEE